MNMFITETKNTIKTIKRGDKTFKIRGCGLLASDRASIEIDQRCPPKYASIIVEAYNAGWLSPVAHVTEKEYILMGLSNDIT